MTSHATEDATAPAKTITALLDAGLLDAADVAERIGRVEGRYAAIAELTEIAGVGKTGAHRIVTWLRSLGWPAAFEIADREIEIKGHFDTPGEHPHLTQWRDKLAELFPANDIELPFDIGAEIFRAYEDGRIGAMKIKLRASTGEPRNYLGASSLGAECMRKTWAQWRGIDPDFEGRLLRLFRSGDIYEVRMREELRAIGFRMTADQSGFKAFKARVKGHCDGFAQIAGLPLALWECKSAKGSRVKALKKLLRDFSDSEALKLWDRKYWAQAHIYMRAFGVHVCLFSVTCKDDDKIITLLFERDDDAVKDSGERARLILGEGTPPRAYERPQHKECGLFCDSCGWCWHGEPIPRVCGSCVSWRDGVCTRHGGPAIKTCDDYEAVSIDQTRSYSAWDTL